MSKYIYFCDFFAYLKSSLSFEISKPIYYVEKTKNSWIYFSEFPIYLFSNRSFQCHQKRLTTRLCDKRVHGAITLRFFWYNSWFNFSKIWQIWNHRSSCDVHQPQCYRIRLKQNSFCFQCLDETHLCFFFVFEFDLNKSKITKLFIVNSFNAIEGQLTCSSFVFASFIFCSSCSNRIFTFTTAYSTYQTWQKLFGWNSILLSKLWSDWGRSCQNFPRATKVWSWHTNNQTSNALTYETLGRFLSDTDDWLMLKYFTHPIVHNTRFTHLRLANIPMQIRAGAFVGSIQKLKNDHHF